MYYSELELRSISTELTVLQLYTHCRPGNEAIHSAENLVCGTIGYTRDARLLIRPLSASFHLWVTTYHSHHIALQSYLFVPRSKHLLCFGGIGLLPAP